MLWYDKVSLIALGDGMTKHALINSGKKLTWSQTRIIVLVVCMVVVLTKCTFIFFSGDDEIEVVDTVAPSQTQQAGPSQTHQVVRARNYRSRIKDSDRGDELVQLFFIRLSNVER